MSSEVHGRFNDWLIDPVESIDFEVKRWMDLNEKKSQAKIAKELIALENSGGGYLLFGYLEDSEKKLVPDPNRPASLKPYLADAMNAIIERYAEPTFHVDVHLPVNRVTKEEFPLVRVSGMTRVPVRSKREMKEAGLGDFKYYIRASGPQSREPRNGLEWDRLLRSKVELQRSEIVAMLRKFLPFGDLNSSPDEPPSLEPMFKKFRLHLLQKWEELERTLPEGHQGKVKYGKYCLSASIGGAKRRVPSKKLLEIVSSARKYTGWPVFVCLSREDGRPRYIDDGLEAWTANGGIQDVSVSDYWRIEDDGRFFLLRGYESDSEGGLRKPSCDPGTIFDPIIAIWRVAEFILRVEEIAREMFEGEFQISIDGYWNGLSGRSLRSISGRRFFPPGLNSEQDVVESMVLLEPGSIPDFLADYVDELTAPLFRAFGETQISRKVIEEEVAELRQQNF